MFIGSIEQLENENGIYPPVLLWVLQYLRTQDFLHMESGRHEIKDGMYFNLDRYKTKAVEECLPERHVKYIDVQYVADGEECLGWCPLSPDLHEVIPYDETKDIVFYQDLVPESSIILLKGNFAVLYPDDVHRPCVAVDEPGDAVTKVVVKIPTVLLEEKA